MADAVLLGIVCIGLFGLRAIWVNQAAGPFVFRDEFIYKAASESIFQGNGYFVDQKLVTVFPPLYSILITPAFWAGAAFYTWILFVNAALSASALVPVWLFAKQWLPRWQSWLCVLLLAVNPAQWVSTRIIESDNLFLPLFLWGCYLLCLDSRRGVWRHLLLGIVLGLGGLTQHPTLAVWPFALLLWWRQPWLLGTALASPEFKQQRRQAIGLAVIGLALSYTPWLWYVLAHGSSVQTAIGLTLLDDQRLTLNTTNLLTRTGLWFMYSIVALVLVNGVLLHGLTAQIALLRRRFAYRRDTYLATLIIGGILTFFGVGLLYSVLGNLAQNIVTEHYYGYFAPLLPVVALRVFSRLRKFHPNQRASLAIDSAMAAGIPIVIAWQLVRNSAPDYFQIHEATSSYALARPIGSLWQLDLVFLVLVALVVSIAALYRWPKQIALIVTLGAAAIYAAMILRIGTVLPEVQSAANHGHTLATEIQYALNDGDPPRPVAIYLDGKYWPSAAPFGLIYPIRFWDVPADAFTLQLATRDQIANVPSGFWLTGTHLSDSPLTSYQVARAMLYLYRLPLQAGR